MKHTKIFVLLLVMVATSTVSLLSCRKKEVVSVTTEKEYGVQLSKQERTWLATLENEAQKAIEENPDAKTSIAIANPDNPYDYVGTDYVAVLNDVKNHISTDVVYVNDSTLNACVTETNIYNRIKVCPVLTPNIPPCPVSNFRFGAQTVFHLYSDYFSETDSILGVLLSQNRITNAEYATMVTYYDLTNKLPRNAFIAVTKVFENATARSMVLSSPQKLRLFGAFATSKYAKDYWTNEVNNPTSAFKPLFDRFTQDPKLFIYEFVDMATMGYLVGQTQDNQITKGTRVAALYSYSDVIFILRPKNKYECGPYTTSGPGSDKLYKCSTNPGHECRYPGAVCGNASESTSRKTKFLFCN